MPPLEFDWLPERYDFELERRDRLTDSLNLPISVLGALGSLLAVMAGAFTYSDQLLTVIFLLLLVAAVGVFLGCLVLLGRVYHRQTTIYLPSAGELERTREKYLECAPVMAGGIAEVLDAFEANLRARIIEAVDHNTANNDERSSLMYWARLCLFILLCITALAGFFYIADRVRTLNDRTRNLRTTTHVAGAADLGSAALGSSASSISAESRGPRASPISAESRD
jgi:hypothetical protein